MKRKNMEEFMDVTAKSRKRRRDDQYPPPPPPKGSDQSKKTRHDFDASCSKQTLAQTSSAWKSSDTRYAPSSSSKEKPNSQSEQPTNDIPILDDMHPSDPKDTGADHLLKIKTRPDWLKPIPEEETLETPELDWLTKADLEGPAFKLVKPFHKNNISFQFKMEECHLLLTDKIDLTNPEGNRVVPNIGDKDRRHALLISKLKAAYYQDFRLEELVPSLWIESECEYDVSAAYGILHWWFKRNEFYITRHSAPFDRHAVRSHMKILRVVSLKTYSRYGYTYLKEIVL
ncbi:hypothetical protein Tco_0707187 [Tanacetum coccineum]|uniref:Uncharacterized protein n=1 Tax=Tanacetum coccineum TaxID=301880 RepID=A0ABQ4YAK5_9ASTR